MKFKQLFSIALAASVALTFSACSDDDDTDNATANQTDEAEEEEIPEFVYSIPTYKDNYVDIASWSYKDEWNLANTHDPSVAYYKGYYYMYGTDASYGNAHESCTSGKHFQGKRSSDLVNWSWVKGPFNSAPSWVADSLNSIRSQMGLAPIAKSDISYGYWAPVVRSVTVDGTTKLRMYYSIVIDNYIKTGAANTTANFDNSWTERAFIGMCESTDPKNGTWEDKGFVTCSSSDKGIDGWTRSTSSNYDAYFYFNAIDPTYIVAPDGKHYLIYGSWHSGFALLEIDPDSGKPVNELGSPWASSPEELAEKGYGTRIGTRTASSRWQGSEGPEIIYKDGYYYLFMAYDALAVPYNTRVVRAESIEGPYYDITGRNFTNGAGDCYPIVTHPYKFSRGYGWVGISHCAIFQKEGTDDWFYMSQARFPENIAGINASNALMMGHVHKLVWCPASVDEPDNLWPIALPERFTNIQDPEPIADTELVGTWEHIKLAYNYGTQDTYETLTLSDDGTMSGALEGTWSYDATTSQLTLGNVVVVVEREVDWEASPRAETIVYAGTQKSLNATYWGKKVD